VTKESATGLFAGLVKHSHSSRTVSRESIRSNVKMIDESQLLHSLIHRCEAAYDFSSLHRMPSPKQELKQAGLDELELRRIQSRSRTNCRTVANPFPPGVRNRRMLNRISLPPRCYPSAFCGSHCSPRLIQMSPFPAPFPLCWLLAT
jgi:hypothetical protein